MKTWAGPGRGFRWALGTPPPLSLPQSPEQFHRLSPDPVTAAARVSRRRAGFRVQQRRHQLLSSRESRPPPKRRAVGDVVYRIAAKGHQVGARRRAGAGPAARHSAVCALRRQGGRRHRPPCDPSHRALWCVPLATDLIGSSLLLLCFVLLF